ERESRPMTQDLGTTKIAIACQGGGSHTAFTAGVLCTLLKHLDERFEIVALTGTSGGAVCAALAWFGLINKDRKEAARLLRAFWESNAATEYFDIWINFGLLQYTR